MPRKRRGGVVVKLNREALAAYLINTASERFEWGVCDCVTFSAMGAEAAWNTNILDFFPNWNNETEASQRIREYGKDLREAGSRCLLAAGCSKVQYPQPGDIAIADLTVGITFCLCIDDKMMAAMSKNGILFFPVKGDIWRFTGCQQ